jgi:uncharacterized protein involved in copper resistance
MAYQPLVRACLILCGVALLGTACARPITPTSEPDVTPMASPTATPTQKPGASPVATPKAPGASVSPLGPGKAKTQEGALQQAKADLARRLQLTPEEISVVSVEAVEWSNASIGCPEPGMAYAEVITPGYKIVLKAEGKTYTYHAGGDMVILCQPQGSLSPEAERDVSLAKAALAKRLGIAETEIAVERVEKVEWRNSALGCPKPGGVYLQVIIPGYVVVLKAQGKTYEYHTGDNRAITCDG